MTDNGEAGGGSSRGLKVALISIHGLIRGSELELGRDADTGGQTKYVVQLAEALSACPGIADVRLYTRLLEDPEVDAGYAAEQEQLPGGGAIVRLRAGPDGYIRKEQLYPHLREYTENFLAWCRDNDWKPDVIHGHYADAARAGMDAAEELSVPFVFTGHSLGRNKRKVLLEAGEDEAEIEERFRFSERIGIEEEALRRARIVVASTG